MFCKHCGKEISEKASMCPNCGTLTDNNTVINKPADKKGDMFSTIALVLACFAFLTGVTFGAICCVHDFGALLITVICFTTILPALAAICLGITTLYQKNGSRPSRTIAIVAIALAGVVLLFLYLAACILLG